MTRGVIHLNVLTIQFNDLAWAQSPVVDEGRPGLIDQFVIAAGMIRVPVGIGDKF